MVVTVRWAMMRFASGFVAAALACGPCVAQTTLSEVVLHNFGHFGDATYPASSVIADATGALYGVAASGGAYGFGAVYRLAPPMHGDSHLAETVLYSFAGGADGSSPMAALVMDKAGNLYGTTEAGGSSGSGTVFQLSPSIASAAIWVKTTLHSFGGLGGRDPRAALIIDPHGALYGTTYAGGAAGLGTVFELHPPKPGATAWRKQILYSFVSYDDSCPAAALTFSRDQKTLYGTTTGCAGSGSVFSLIPPVGGESAWTQTILYQFSVFTTGKVPYGNLVIDGNGILYGTTSNSGDEFCDSSGGTVFELIPPVVGQTVWQIEVLHQFIPTTYDGLGPYGGLLMDGRGGLYGTTCDGGVYSRGTVFKLQAPVPGETGWTETLFSLDDTGAAYPGANLIEDKSGARLITTSTRGGSHGLGTIFSVMP